MRDRQLATVPSHEHLHCLPWHCLATQKRDIFHGYQCYCTLTNRMVPLKLI
uniref:Uncharacterized protein n=1 Tax=Arundo donax TaxID=35708 RepID=A0A0A8ZNZ5_ARUDO